MKRILSIALAALMLVSMTLAFASCTQKKDVYKVGICQLAPHPALDAATEGFKKALIDELGADKVEFDVQNAQSSADTCVTIANNFVSKKYDLIMANATAALQACYNATTEIPVLGTSITEYGVALSIKDFNGTVGGNVSGTSDLAPLDQQAQMIIDLFPEAKNVGLLYCSSEPNSDYQVKEVEKYLTDKGLSVKHYKFTDSNDVVSVTNLAATESDVIYIPTDNTAADCASSIYSVVSVKKIPVVAGESGICSGCGVVTLSIDYSDLGYTTGLMAAKILKGEANISDMKIEYTPAEKLKKQYNGKMCELLGITPPEGYTVIEGTEVEAK